MGEAHVTLTAALAASQPYPPHYRYPWRHGIGGPWGSVLLARPACLFTGTFSPPPCGLSRVTAGKGDLRPVLPLAPQWLFSPEMLTS